MLIQIEKYSIALRTIFLVVIADNQRDKHVHQYLLRYIITSQEIKMYKGTSIIQSFKKLNLPLIRSKRKVPLLLRYSRFSYVVCFS